MQVFWQSEIDLFSTIFFKKYHKTNDQAELYRHIQPAIDRFIKLKQEQQESFKQKSSQFLRAYAFLGQIITFADVEMEKFYAYLRLLRNALPKRLEERFQLNDEVALEYYKLNKKGEINVEWETEGVGNIASALQDSGGDSYNKGDETAHLSEIIKSINERLGENLTEADRLLIEQVEMDMIEDDKLQKQAVNNEIGNFKYGFDDVLMNKFVDRMEQNEDFFQKFIKNKEFRDIIGEYLLKRVYKRLSKTVSVKQLIKEGENQNLEFKTSLRWDVKEGKANKDLEKVILKTIAGFMNSEGGQLVIGAEDNGNIVGLEKDYEVLGDADRDKFERHIVQLIINFIGKEYVQFVRITFEKIKGKDLCLVTVRSANKPVYIKSNDREVFYVRTGNATTPFAVTEAVEYINSKFNLPQ